MTEKRYAYKDSPYKGDSAVYVSLVGDTVKLVFSDGRTTDVPYMNRNTVQYQVDMGWWEEL